MSKRGGKRQKKGHKKARIDAAQIKQPQRPKESSKVGVKPKSVKPSLRTALRTESPWQRFWPTVLTGVVAGIAVSVVTIIFSPLYSARLVLATSDEGKADAPIQKVVARDTRPGARVTLREFTVRVRNHGLKGGQIHACEVRPLGVLTNPKVEVVKVTSPVIGPFQTRTVRVSYRVTETPETAPYDLQYQIACSNPDGSPAFNYYALWKVQR